MKNIVLVAAVIVTGNVSADQAVAEPVLYGHKDFVPTPERPIYFRAGNGEYPGATPPLEWREGTVAKIKVAGIYGNPPQYRTNEVFGFSDAQSKNILWKVPVPGWSLSHPIVVGKKVFAVGKPDFVTCCDLETGKQLWQRRIMPLLLDGLPEEKAVAGQKVLDMGGIHHCRSFVSDTAVPVKAQVCRYSATTRTANPHGPWRDSTASVCPASGSGGRQ